MTAAAIDTSRRAFLRGGARRPDPVRPPWALAGLLTDLCTRCGRCEAACPEGIVATGDGGFPEIDFTRAECSFCGACAEACPAGLFAPRDLAPWHLRVTVAEGCIARTVVCRSCADACPERALSFPRVVGGGAPTVNAAACTGCGACVSACPVRAVSITPTRHQEAAA